MMISITINTIMAIHGKGGWLKEETLIRKLQIHFPAHTIFCVLVSRLISKSWLLHLETRGNKNTYISRVFWTFSE